MMYRPVPHYFLFFKSIPQKTASKITDETIDIFEAEKNMLKKRLT